MRAYYRSTVETWGYRVADAFFEFTDGLPTRQVTHDAGRWLCSLDDSDADVGPLLTDQPLQPGEFAPAAEITAEQFEDAWARALAQRK